MTAGARRLPHSAHEYDARLQHALRTVKVGAWSLDLVNGSRIWSRELASLMGLPPDADLDRELLTDALHPDDRERVREIARQALEQGASFETDCRVVWPDQSVHWIAIKACVHLDATGRPICMEGVTQDVEERKRLELALQESRRMLCDLVAQLPGVVYRTRNDPHWTADFVSEGVQSLTGHSAADFMERRISFEEVIHPDDRRRVRSEVEAALAERRRYQVDYRIVTASGDVRLVWEQGAGVRSEQGEVRFLEGFLMDVTDRRRAEEEAARLQTRLRQTHKMEALGTLAGGIAHDFNNVLTAIRGNARLAMADLPPESEAFTSVLEIMRSAARATDLVRQIVAFSRQEQVQRRPICLQPIVAETLRLLRASLPALIEIRSRYAPNLPLVLADATQIHQVVMNLGVNAAQAIGARAGVIEFKLDLVMVSADGTRRTAELEPGPYVQLQVKDNGCGMDEATIERVYDPFFTTKPAGQGAGLGLSVVHGIMQAHQGAISVESTPGGGTTFCLCFPVAQETPASDEAANSPPPRGRGERILFVDDEEALVFLAERALQRLGYKVEGYMDPTRALQAFRASPKDFDFVVTDLSMPGISGRDFARELLRIRPDIPIVLTSGYLRSEEVQEARRAGVRDVVFKPNSIDELARAIDEALAAKARR